MTVQNNLFEYLLRLADDRLVLGHRLSEWCGHAHIIEEDIALANIALDLIGQASALLKYAGEVEGQGRSEDDLAYLRSVIQYKNLQLVEQPKGDFGFTIARQFLFDVYSCLLLKELEQSKDDTLAGIAAKALKEDTYHLRHSKSWVIRLGDGTDESNQRVAESFKILWRFTAEMFESDKVEQQLVSEGLAVDCSKLKDAWLEEVTSTLRQAKLPEPELDVLMIQGSRHGKHGEHLGHLLAEMQTLQRTYPGAEW